MEPFPRRCVVDASVLIDLNNGDVLHFFCRMPFEIIIPDLIVAEELQSIEVQQLFNWGVRVQGLSPSQVIEVYTLAQFHRSVSVKDLFAFVLARDLDATLLTGDGALRRFAEREGVSVHGTLWVLEGMVNLGYLEPVDALASLERILVAGSRLPEREIQRLRQRWRR